MKIFAHRINTRAQLDATPTDLGLELDLRSQGNRVVIHHDPFVEGEDFEDWLGGYRHNGLILNVKEEGLEQRLLECMERHGIEDFFFLDQSFPFLVKTANGGERRCAVRVSEYENIDTAMTLAGQIEWVWVDCFTHFPLTMEAAEELRDAGFRLCLVSPELQGRTGDADVIGLRDEVAGLGIQADAVCTKRPELWRS